MLKYTLILAVLAFSAVESKTCGPYPYVEVEHGRVQRAGYMKYVVRCDKGYTLLFSKSPRVKCRRGEWWPSEKPTCRRKEGRCDDPPVVSHAKIYGEERDRGATVKYMCDEGYILLGHSELTCSGGYWNKRAPTCMEESEPIQNVAERLNSDFVTNIANYSADTPEGRSLDSDSLNLGLELYIVIDRSSSVDPVQLEDGKTFVKFLLRRFAVNNGEDNERGTRVSVIAFGTDVQRIISVTDRNISNPTLAAHAVDGIQPNGGGTNLESALKLPLLEEAFEGNLRKEAKRALFLLTDGEPNIANPDITPQDVARRLKEDLNFEIFTVGIGKGINIHLLNDLASEPPLSHVFMLEDYTNLNDIIKIIQKAKPKPPPVSKDQCGYNATGENEPWNAVIYIGGTPFKVCGGVLVCSHWILTAASCLREGHVRINPQDVFVVLGEQHLLLKDKGQTNFYVVDVRIHPRYDPEQQVKNDLALLKIYVPNDEKSKYRPACLPLTDRVVPFHLNLEINASIAGWGTTSASPIAWARADDLSIFQRLTTPVSLSEENECPIRRHGLSALCAGQGSRACYGLLGSPLMAVDSSTGLQHVLGILSHRVKCTEGQNQYVELTKYIPWINHETKECQLKHWGLSE